MLKRVLWWQLIIIETAIGVVSYVTKDMLLNSETYDTFSVSQQWVAVFIFLNLCFWCGHLVWGALTLNEGKPVREDYHSPIEDGIDFKEVVMDIADDFIPALEKESESGDETKEEE